MLTHIDHKKKEDGEVREGAGKGNKEDIEKLRRKQKKQMIEICKRQETPSPLSLSGPRP